jgi:hypothetical protein
MKYTPPQPRDWDFHKKYWPYVAYGLYLLAHNPGAARIEHEREIARRFDHKFESEFVQNVFRRELLDTEMIEAQNFSYVNSHKLVAVRLTQYGQECCRELGWEPCENEWEALLRRHDGYDQPRHTGSVLLFAFAARTRGWKTTMLPVTEHSNLFPDLMIEKQGKRHYVEVELGDRKYAKWNNYKKYLGQAALCAVSERSRNTLIRECRSAGLDGVATDLLYLARTHDPQSPLWLQTWNAHGEELLDATKLEDEDEYGNY